MRVSVSVFISVHVTLQMLIWSFWGVYQMINLLLQLHLLSCLEANTARTHFVEKRLSNCGIVLEFPVCSDVDPCCVVQRGARLHSYKWGGWNINTCQCNAIHFNSTTLHPPKRLCSWSWTPHPSWREDLLVDCYIRLHWFYLGMQPFTYLHSAVQVGKHVVSIHSQLPGKVWLFIN